ncbi:uncharacterized protein B0I36DRAFT_104293 [Microdochium trichocladiopsis]|uniref:Uncharacterized protein n=1 Tax=Microdochium trichocladiopsis TaxID=1682393 RepID=A0A9P9BRL3_9PEZI|nr:uncharacterized protein B0I36DRAFT_104293 [Microdochium trichocladiopsis]KAH7033041.1 hypothetical protein B0I36DRAFT_104293 [Microdochium trichocladiopsis]
MANSGARKAPEPATSLDVATAVLKSTGCARDAGGRRGLLVCRAAPGPDQALLLLLQKQLHDGVGGGDGSGSGTAGAGTLPGTAAQGGNRLVGGRRGTDDERSNEMRHHEHRTHRAALKERSRIARTTHTTRISFPRRKARPPGPLSFPSSQGLAVEESFICTRREVRA